MRLKFLSVIIGFLSVSIGISSCLGSGENNEYSTDASIRAFGLDTIYGKHYKFTIDQLRSVIFNVDSLPQGADTILDRILIDTLTVTGWATLRDTAITSTDSVDLRGAINKSGSDGLELKVYSANSAGNAQPRLYKLQIRKRMQDPDSLVWRNLETPLSTSPVSQLKAVLLGERLMVYTSNTQVYEGSTADALASGWQSKTLSGLPADIKLGTVLNFKNQLYLTTESGKFYTSTDGLSWSTKATENLHMVTTVTCIADSMVVIAQAEDGINYFYTSTDASAWTQGQSVPDNFPLDGLYATQQTTTTDFKQVLVVGNPPVAGKAVVPWATMNGIEWVDFSTPTGVYCPYMTNPAIIYYGGSHYIFGGDFSAIYNSQVGIAWQTTSRKFLLPAAMKGNHTYSMVVDAKQYIWVVIGQTDKNGTVTAGTVWRGRQNGLPFN
ncbi:MAG: DUF6242 domain-containing protein [Mediterranea sp.]|jgi:hypothetical protein|nr:DUF6242 domain-containing protein [Mediterranea sp.]